MEGIRNKPFKDSQADDDDSETSQYHESTITLPEKRALSLIYFDEKEGFKVSEEAVEFLTSIKEKIGVIGNKCL